MDEDLQSLTREQLIGEVERLRAGIREHRDATGHDLCWHHPKLWGLLPERADPQPTVPNWPQFMRGCVRYRQSLDEQLPAATRSDLEFDEVRRGASGLRSQPLICVRDVAASSRWYRQLLGCTSGHGGDEYERVMAGGEIALQLHAWEVHEHENLGDPEALAGNGVALWFQVDEFDAVVERARTLKAQVLEEPHINEKANHRECWLHDPDGYVIVLASIPGDVEPRRR